MEIPGGRSYSEFQPKWHPGAMKYAQVSSIWGLVAPFLSTERVQNDNIMATQRRDLPDCKEIKLQLGGQ